MGFIVTTFPVGFLVNEVLHLPQEVELTSVQQVYKGERDGEAELSTQLP